MSNALTTLTNKFAAQFGIEKNQQELIDTLKATAFKGGNVTDAQMTALMLVAQQYSLNPWTREIYAFPDKGGIVPVVGVDGWSRIMNDHPQFDGMDFEQDDDKCTCIIYRKDRSHPIKTTEFFSECKRETQPWKSHPRRMLRHKSMIQCARLAFGFGGIFDQDEAERIVEATVIDASTGEIVPAKKELPVYTEEQMTRNLAAWKESVEAGKTTPDRIIAKVSSGYRLTEDHINKIRALKKQEQDSFVADMEAAEQKQGEQQ